MVRANDVAGSTCSLVDHWSITCPFATATITAVPYSSTEPPCTESDRRSSTSPGPGELPAGGRPTWAKYVPTHWRS